jgi:hypothetical protein
VVAGSRMSLRLDFELHGIDVTMIAICFPSRGESRFKSIVTHESLGLGLPISSRKLKVEDTD